MNITVLHDYKGNFESKYTAIPYRSGFDKELLKKYFLNYGINIDYKSFSDIDFVNNNYEGKYFIYTSSEDQDGFYKTYIDDIIYGLSLIGAIVLPDYKFLKAHHNKVFMEVLRSQSKLNKIKNLRSEHFGTIEEFNRKIKNISFPFVIKPSEGSMSRGVSLISDVKMLKKVKKISKSRNFLIDIKDFLRTFIHKGYVLNSRNRKKFISQNYIENLDGDWKILIYYDKIYVLKRQNRDKDFRASGGGDLIFTEDIPNGLLDFSFLIYNSLNVPNLSIDISENKNEFNLIEFQALYFGTFTIEFSDFYFQRINNTWELVKEKSILEDVYARSISKFVSVNSN